MENLFIESSLTFEKLGSEVTLPEDPNTWPNEILQELFKQVPYIADFEPHVVMDRVDAERGYAFGHIEVINKTEMQRGVNPSDMASAGIRQARVPVIVKDRKLQPFDVVVTEESKILPLTEARLRQAVFRPQAFDVTSRTPGDTSMIGQLYPPYRQNYGFGGGGATMSVGMGKQGSAEKVAAPQFLLHLIYQGDASKAREGKAALVKQFGKDHVDIASHDEYIKSYGSKEKKASLLEAILPTINEEDYTRTVEKLSHYSADLLQNSHFVAKALDTLSKYTPEDRMKTASALFSRIKPTVVQVSKSDDGYTVKAASHLMWLPIDYVHDRGQLIRAFGEKIALAADMNGAVTMADGASQGEHADMPEADKPELIKDFGLYKVQDEKGRELVGYVIPNLIDVDGKSLPISLFTNGSQSALQGEIVGIHAGEGNALPEGHPRGHGCFYLVLPNGKAQATVPMTLQGSLEEEGSVVISGETFAGTPVEVSIQPNIQMLQAVDGRLLVPENMRWLPLDDAEEVVLTSDPEQAQKTAGMHLPPVTVTIRSAGMDSFSFSGLPLEKLAYEEKNFLNFNESTFLLAGFGLQPQYAMNKLAQAHVVQAPLDVQIGRGIKLARDMRWDSLNAAAGTLAKIPDFRVDLVKEAAVIPDPVAVDTILSLGFVNPENVTTFIGYLPVIDEAQSKMCELLIAARLGQRDINVGALEKAIRSTEEVIDGLKVMAFQRN